MDIRILFVDDEADDVFFAEQSLRRADLPVTSYRVFRESDFRQALLGWQPNIIVADVYIPGFDVRCAFELAQQLAPETPFLLRSGGVRGRIAFDLLAKGADGYVEKGDEPAFVEAVRALTAHRPDVSESEPTA
jgi:CheY-like chemotaxis protein